MDNITPSFASLFLSKVSKCENNDALFINNRVYTYHELLSIVNTIYYKLPTDKIADKIGIYCNNDVFTYASIIAVNLYGAAYVPLNKKFPVTRNKKHIKICDLRLVLSSELNEDVKNITEDIELIVTGYDIPKTYTEKISMKEYEKTNQPIAYMMFTSGTTGEPKGVPVSHANLSSFFNYFFENYNFSERDRFLQVYELTFDVSVFSFFMPLMVGACCYVLPDEGVKYFKIMEEIKAHEITVVSMVPTVLRYVQPYFKELSFPSLRYSFFSGDALLHSIAVEWNKCLPDGAIHNFYGPAETTIVCSRYIFSEEYSQKESTNNIVPIGKLFEGMDYLIVDENNAPTEKGELCISGTQVIGNYLNNTNEEKFFLNKNKQYYKTGDIASLNEFGNLVFHGRTDSQVKINGYRIELTEVENAISSIVNSAVVVLCKRGLNGVNKLIAYIESLPFDAMELKQKLSSLLPPYMIPHDIVAVEKFGRNINGKVDKQQLEKIN